MQVDRSLLEKVLVGVVRQAKVVSVRAEEREGDLSRLFDDFAEFSRQLDTTSGHGLRGAFVRSSFDEERRKDRLQ